MGNITGQAVSENLAVTPLWSDRAKDPATPIFKTGFGKYPKSSPGLLFRSDRLRLRAHLPLAQTAIGALSHYDDSRTWKYRLNESEILQTFAEVGVAIAGFTGVVFVLGNRATGEWPHAERMWFRVLLESSLCVVFFALLPVVLASYLSSSTVWRLSDGLLGICALGMYAAWSFRFWPHLQAFPIIWRRLAAIPSTVLMPLQIVACLLVAAGRLSEFQALVYLLMLLSLVGLALFNFALLLATSMRDRRGGE